MGALESRALSDGQAASLYSYRMQTTLYTGPKKSLVAYAFVLMCAVGIGGLLSGCDGGTHLEGVVLDSNDTPIADAKRKASDWRAEARSKIIRPRDLQDRYDPLAFQPRADLGNHKTWVQAI